jgi:hypothetical protein
MTVNKEQRWSCKREPDDWIRDRDTNEEEEQQRWPKAEMEMVACLSRDGLDARDSLRPIAEILSEPL